MDLSFRDLRRGLLHRGDDVGIGGAAADIAAHIFADVGVAAGMSLLHAGYRRHDLSRRAVTALERIVVDESLLHRMQAIAGGETFDGGDLLALRRKRERQAGHHATLAHQYRTGAASAVIA